MKHKAIRTKTDREGTKRGKRNMQNESSSNRHKDR